MLNVAFTYIDKDEWMGGYNYLLNLFSALELLPGCDINPMLFVGKNVQYEALHPFEMLPNVTVVRSKLFNRRWKERLLLQSVVFGKNNEFDNLFQRNGIDVIIENACFFGWRFKIPTIAWMPDFQHRHLPDMFSFLTYWKREIGFRAQIFSGRAILLSSENAKKDFGSFYSFRKRKVFVVPFSVKVSAKVLDINPVTIREKYHLPELFYFLPNQFWKHKNHDLVIDALHILKNWGTEVVVAVSGSSMGTQASQIVNYLKEKARAFQVERNFLFLGSIPYEDVVGLMRASRALLNPSLFEGWSTTVEEAKALGIPMILSDLTVHKEQAKEQAVFFDRHSPISLAKTLVNFSELDNDGRFLKGHRATHETMRHRKIFAQKFADMLFQCIEGQKQQW
jgi:glycosyltransferase involved in cell wall biosynthesis